MLVVIIIVSLCIIALLFAVIVTRADLRRELSGENLKPNKAAQRDDARRQRDRDASSASD